MWRCWENSMVAISLKASFIGPMVKSRTRRNVPRAKCVMGLYMRFKPYLEDGWKVKTVVFGPYSSSNIYQIHHLSTITTLNIAKPPILHVSPLHPRHASDKGAATKDIHKQSSHVCELNYILRHFSEDRHKWLLKCCNIKAYHGRKEKTNQTNKNKLSPDCRWWPFETPAFGTSLCAQA